jgi:hypothetical protein
MKDSSAISERIRCCHDICGSFRLLDQIDMMDRLVQASTKRIDDEVDDDSDDDVDMMDGERSTSDLLLKLPILVNAPESVHNNVKVELMKFVNIHLSKKSFLKKLHQLQLAIKKRTRDSARKSSKTTKLMIDTCAEMEKKILSSCERILYAIQDDVTEKKNEHHGKDADELNEQEDMASIHHEILGKMCSMLTVPSFLVVVTELLEAEEGGASIRQRALTLLNERVVDDASFFDGAEIDLFLELVDELSTKAFTTSGTTKPQQQEQRQDLPPHVLQCYLYSLGILTTAFAGDHPDRFVGLLTPLTNVLKTTGAVQSVQSDLSIAALRSTTFSTLASLCTKLGPRVLPTLPVLVPSIMNDVGRCVTALSVTVSSPTMDSSASSTILLRGALSALLMVLKHIPQFMTPYLRSILTMTFSDKTHTTMSQVELKTVDDILHVICLRHDARILLPILNTMIGNAAATVTNTVSTPAIRSNLPLTWTDATVTRTFDALTSVVERMTTKDARLYHKDLHSLCLRAGGHVHETWSDGRDAIVECVVTTMLKLSERRMKPMFVSVVEWSMKEERYLFLYSLVISLSDRLKSIFTPFYEYFMVHITKDMQRFVQGLAASAASAASAEEDSDDDSDDERGDGRSRTQGGRRKSKKRKKTKKKTIPILRSSELEYERIEMATQCMLNCFTYDNAATTANVKDYGTFDFENSPFVVAAAAAAVVVVVSLSNIY